MGDILEMPELLIDRNLGHLRFPDKFRKIYGTPKNYPEPQAKAEVGDTKIRLIFEFDARELDELKRGK